MLRILDVARAKDFWVDLLGFTVDWEHRFHKGGPVYFQVSRGEVKFNLSEHANDGEPGSHVFVTMTGVDEYHTELLAKSAAHTPGIANMPRGNAHLHGGGPLPQSHQLQRVPEIGARGAVPN